MGFADVVTVPVGNVDYYVAFDHGLAAETGIELEVGGLLDAVHFVVVHLGKVVHALFDHHMARGARAASAAGVFQMKTEVHRHVQQRFGTPVILVGKLAGLEFESFSGGEKSYLGHYSIVTVGAVPSGRI